MFLVSIMRIAFPPFTDHLGACKKAFKDADAHQKICQVAIAIIQAINLYCDTHYLEKFVKLLDTANLHDFYEFLKLPSTLLYPICFERIESIQIQQRNDQLIPFVNKMADKGRAYRSVDELKAALAKKLNVEANTIEVSLKPISILEALSMGSFTFVTVGYVPLFLQEWKVIDLSGIAHQLGRYQVSSWISTHSLDQWVRGGLCAGFLVRFVEASWLLYQGQKSFSDKRRAQWDLITGLTEFVFNYAVLRGHQEGVVIALTFIAKSIGLLSIFYKPKAEVKDVIGFE